MFTKDICSCLGVFPWKEIGVQSLQTPFFSSFPQNSHCGWISWIAGCAHFLLLGFLNAFPQKQEDLIPSRTGPTAGCHGTIWACPTRGVGRGSSKHWWHLDLSPAVSPLPHLAVKRGNPPLPRQGRGSHSSLVWLGPHSSPLQALQDKLQYL